MYYSGANKKCGLSTLLCTVVSFGLSFGQGTTVSKGTTANLKPDTIINEVLISVGTNLNLIDSEQTSGLYYDINAFIPSLLESRPKWGLEARFSQGRLVPQTDTSSLRERYVSDINPLLPPADTLDVIRQTYRNVTQDQNSQLTLSLSPAYRLTKDTSLFAIGHFEFRRVSRNVSSASLVTEEERFRLANSDLGSRTVRSNALARDFDITQQEYEFNYGVGFKLFVDLGVATMNLKPVIGRRAGRASKDWWYFTHFEVIERILGIKFGGELRGLIPGNQRDAVRNQYEPSVGIYVAKSVKFSKIKDILKLDL